MKEKDNHYIQNRVLTTETEPTTKINAVKKKKKQISPRKQNDNNGDGDGDGDDNDNDDDDDDDDDDDSNSSDDALLEMLGLSSLTTMMKNEKQKSCATPSTSSKIIYIPWKMSNICSVKPTPSNMSFFIEDDPGSNTRPPAKRRKTRNTSLL